MNVTLNPELSALVESAVSSGRFASVEEVITAGVLQLIAPDADMADDMREEVAIGLRDADAGNFVEFTAADIIAISNRSAGSSRRG